jgi:endonuclease III
VSDLKKGAILNVAAAEHGVGLREVLKQLESFYGIQEVSWPADPYEFLIWWHCGYPASDTACEKGWRSLQQHIGVKPEQILAATDEELARALKPGGMVPELRAMRLKEIADRTEEEFSGNLAAALAGPIPQARKILKSFPSIGDPGADRILLFSGIDPVAAVPSNCPHVLVRMQSGPEGEKYGATYSQAQEWIETDIAAKQDERIRAFLLLKRHGQETCKRTNPKCSGCPVRGQCAYFVRTRS